MDTIQLFEQTLHQTLQKVSTADGQKAHGQSAQEPLTKGSRLRDHGAHIHLEAGWSCPFCHGALTPPNA